jgi:hypothetical protein
LLLLCLAATNGVDNGQDLVLEQQSCEEGPHRDLLILLLLLLLLLLAFNRVHNGQDLVLEQQSCEEGPPRDLLMGLFGTTAFYEHVTSTQMLPLEKCARLTRVLRGMRVSRTNQPASLRLFRSLCIVSIPLLRSEKLMGFPALNCASLTGHT